MRYLCLIYLDDKQVAGVQRAHLRLRHPRHLLLVEIDQAQVSHSALHSPRAEHDVPPCGKPGSDPAKSTKPSRPPWEGDERRSGISTSGELGEAALQEATLGGL